MNNERKRESKRSGKKVSKRINTDGNNINRKKSEKCFGNRVNNNQRNAIFIIGMNTIALSIGSIWELLNNWIRVQTSPQGIQNYFVLEEQTKKFIDNVKKMIVKNIYYFYWFH